jgi:hypothetical protein
VIKEIRENWDWKDKKEIWDPKETEVQMDLTESMVLRVLKDLKDQKDHLEKPVPSDQMERRERLENLGLQDILEAPEKKEIRVLKAGMEL